MVVGELRKVVVGGLDRAARHDIEDPVLYRLSDEIGWREGRTENISRTGVLFRAEQLLGVNTTVEMTYELPLEIGGDGEAKVLCRGRIVRAVPPTTRGKDPMLAAKITDYRLVCDLWKTA